MIYPSLVRTRDCKIPITVNIYTDKTDENGKPVLAVDKTLNCNYQGSAKRRYDADHNIVEITGTALFTGDAFPEVPEITGGDVVLFGVKRHIYRGYKERNPDGTINYTRLELM